MKSSYPKEARTATLHYPWTTSWYVRSVGVTYESSTHEVQVVKTAHAQKGERPHG